jgi:hypothetical protein
MRSLVLEPLVIALARVLRRQFRENVRELAELCLRTFWTSAREFSPLNLQAR